MKRISIILIILTLAFVSFKQNTVRVAVVKYGGGGDWYSNPTSLPNLVTFCNENIPASISNDVGTVEVGSAELFNYAFVHLTGHGNVFFTPAEVKNLRTYLTSGGFLHIDDNYGIDKYIRREMKKVFPESEFVELPITHDIYHQTFDFPKGLPKIHEHDNKPPQGFGIFYKDKLVCFYTYECDLGDGWEDESVHHDSFEKRQKALQMGANIVQYAFEN